MKGHSGKVGFNDTEKEINFNWSKSSQSDFTKAKFVDTNTLSGGERSYTTIAFLLSMYKVVNVPFRVLDEFDVFMDAASRTTVLWQLIGFIFDKRLRPKQYILISPQDMSQVHKLCKQANVPSADYKVLKVSPPVDFFGVQSHSNAAIRAKNVLS